LLVTLTLEGKEASEVCEGLGFTVAAAQLLVNGQWLPVGVFS
jgi:hypothetical protein